MFFGGVSDGSELASIHDAVRDTDAHHEVVGGECFSAFAAYGSHAITLGVNAPPLEVGRGPLRRNRSSTLAGKLTNLLHLFPRVESALEPLYLLRLGFLRCLGRFCHESFRREPNGLPENAGKNEKP